MKYSKSKSLLLMMIVIPWFTLPLLGKGAFKRFLPATIFISIVSRVIYIIGEKRKWWAFYTKVSPKISGDTGFVFGPFFVTALWILKLTYKKFSLYNYYPSYYI